MARNQAVARTRRRQRPPISDQSPLPLPRHHCRLLPFSKKTDSPRRNGSSPSSAAAAESASGQDTEPYEGWLLEPVGLSDDAKSQADDLP